MKVDIINKDNFKNIAVVRLAGRLDAQHSESIEEKLIQLVNDGHVYFIIDMADMNYLGSSGIRIFLGLNNQVKSKSGNLKIINMPDTGIKILRAMEIIDRFEFYESENEALNSYK